MKELISAVVKAQSEFLAVKRDETAQILTKSGAKFSYQYANLETCIEQTKSALHSNGLAVIQTLGYREGHTVVITKLLHVSGQGIEGEQILECSDPKDPQKVGSAITYLRRYGYMAILGIAAEDDDGNTASAQKPLKQAESKVESKPEAVKAIEKKFEKPAEKFDIKAELESFNYNTEKKRSEYLVRTEDSQYNIFIKKPIREIVSGQKVDVKGFCETEFKGKMYYFADDITPIAISETEVDF